MSTDYGQIYTLTGNEHRGTELRCKTHPDWRADADWTVMDTAFQRAEEHLENDHRLAA